MKKLASKYRPVEIEERGLPAERPHPLMKIPGVRGAVWEKRLGRWVVHRRWS